MSDVDRRIASLARGQHGVVALAQLRRRGIGEKAIRHRLADRRLNPLFRGVFVVGVAHPTLHGRWRGATLALGEGALLSHRDGAALHRISSARQARVDVTVPGRKARAQRGIRPHRLLSPHAADRTVVDGIPVTSLARTLLDLAVVVDQRALRRAYEQAERAQVLDIAAITDLLGRSNGHQGVGKLAALLDYDPAAAAAAESELERLFLDLVRAAGLPAPQTNVLVDDFLVDAFWPDANLVVELDGYEFHRDREVFERDREKIAKLRLAGRDVLPLTYRQVTADPGWVAATTRTLRDRGLRTSHSRKSRAVKTRASLRSNHSIPRLEGGGLRNRPIEG